MRTYSHTILTYAFFRSSKKHPTRKTSHYAALGATLPDIPMALGGAWLWTKTRGFSRSGFDEEVCGRTLFRAPDAALHGIFPIAAAMLIEQIVRGRNSAFLLGWLGHVLTDFLTHGKDARPILWPLSEWRFHSPISYREKKRYGRIFTVVEHAAVLASLAAMLYKIKRVRE